MIQAGPDERTFMRQLVYLYGDDREGVCEAYREAERTGVVQRTRGPNGASAEKHAKALYRDLRAKG